MPNNIPNSTDYEHPNEPNLVNLHKALEYNQNGEPHLRVKVDAGTVTITEIDLGVVEIANDEGNPIPTHTHLYDESENEYTASNPFTIDGTVTIQDGGNSISIDDGGNVITVDGTVNVGNFPATQTVNGTVGITGDVDIGNFPATQTIDGSVSISNFPATQTVDGTVTIQDGGNSITVDGTISVDNFPTSVSLPSAFATINNFEDENNRGWDIQDDYQALFGIRVKPGSGESFRLVNFNITLNGGNAVTMGYQWHMNATLEDDYDWEDLGTTGVQYVKFDDVDGNPNTITSDTEVHSKALVGKSTSDLTEEMKHFPFTDGGIEMFLEIRRLDGGGKQDLWYDLTFAID